MNIACKSGNVPLCNNIFQLYFANRNFKNPRPANEIMEEHLERFHTIISSALCEPLATKSIVEMRHDVLRRIIKKDMTLNTKMWLEEAHFDHRYFPKGWFGYVTNIGDQRTILFPITVRLFLGRSRKLYCADGKELPQR